MNDFEQTIRTIDRVNTTRSLPDPPAFVARRLAADTERLSRATALIEHTEAVNEALYKLVRLLYEAAPDGGFLNVDRRKGRILVPAPWGSDGWQRWGLRNWEAVVLRKILLARMARQDLASLFWYGQNRTRWFIDLEHYPTQAHALAYLKQCPIDAAEWFEHSSTFQRQRERQRRKRAK